MASEREEGGDEVRGGRKGCNSGADQQVSVSTVMAQGHSRLGRLEVIGPGSPAAAERRRFAEEQERRWRRERQAIVLSKRQGQNNVRKGFAKL